MEDVGDRFSLIVCIIYPVLIRLCPLLGLETALQLEFDRHVVKRRLIGRGFPHLFDRRGHSALLAVGQRAVVVEEVVAIRAPAFFCTVFGIRNLIIYYRFCAISIDGNITKHRIIAVRAIALQRLAHRVDIAVALGGVFGQGVGCFFPLLRLRRKMDFIGFVVVVVCSMVMCAINLYLDKVVICVLNRRSILPCAVFLIAPQVECDRRVAALVEPFLGGGILGCAGQRELELAAAVNLGYAAAGVFDTRVVVADGEVVF